MKAALRFCFPKPIFRRFSTRIKMPDKYIVVFKKDVTQDQINEYASGVEQAGGEVTNRYSSALRGFAAKITPEKLQEFQSLQNDIIDYIEPDGVVTTQ